MRFFGDLHGKVFEYFGQAAEVPESIQVGDFGFGFLSPEHSAAATRFQQSGDHVYIRGNHDDLRRCRKTPGWIEDGSYNPHLQMMFVGGARSVDFGTREEGVDWWADEELSEDDLEAIYQIYRWVKPRIMVTHDVSENAARAMFDTVIPNVRFKEASITRTYLQKMLDFHQPDLWVFGHWHTTKKQRLGNTEFVCVGKNEYVDIDLEPYLEEEFHARHLPENDLPRRSAGEPAHPVPLRRQHASLRSRRAGERNAQGTECRWRGNQEDARHECGLLPDR